MWRSRDRVLLPQAQARPQLLRTPITLSPRNVSDSPYREAGVAELGLVHAIALGVRIVCLLAVGIDAHELHRGRAMESPDTLARQAEIGASGKAIAPIPECDPRKTGASAAIHRIEGGIGSSGRQRLRFRHPAPDGVVMCVRYGQYLVAYPAQGVFSTRVRCHGSAALNCGAVRRSCGDGFSGIIPISARSVLFRACSDQKALEFRARRVRPPYQGVLRASRAPARRRPLRPRSRSRCRCLASVGTNPCAPSAARGTERLDGSPRRRSATAGAMLMKSPCGAGALVGCCVFKAYVLPS